MSTDEFEIETLLAREEWVLNVARAVSRGEDAAEDVAQDIWLGLLGRKYPIEKPGGWLRTRARRHAIDKAREEAARRRREQTAARDERLPSTAELIEQATARKEIVCAVLELPEPYRTTILLRYFDDRSSSEIARSLGLPASTVRVRLKRGLEMLREDMKDGPSGRTAVAIVLAAASRETRRWWWPLAAVCAVVALVVGGLMWTSDAGESDVELTEIAGGVPSGSPRRARREGEASETALAVEATHPPKPGRSIRLRGRVVLDPPVHPTRLDLRAERRVRGPDANRQFGLFGKPAGPYRFVGAAHAKPGEPYELEVDDRGLYFVAVTADGVAGFASFFGDPDAERSVSVGVADSIVLELESADVRVRYARGFGDDGAITWANADHSATHATIAGPVFTNIPMRVRGSGDSVEWEVRLDRARGRITPPPRSPLRAVQVIAADVDAAETAIEVQIEAKDRTTWRSRVVPDPDGRCWIPWPRRTDVSWYSFTLSLPDGRLATTGDLRESLTEPGDRLAALRLHAPPPAPRRVRLVDESDRPVSGAALTGCDAGLPVARGLSDDDGHVELRRRLSILELHDGDDMRVAPLSELDVFAVTRDGAVFDLGTLTAGTDGERIVLRVPRARRLSVLVTTTEGAPLPGAELAVSPARDGDPVRRLSPLRPSTTNEAGIVLTEPLGPGGWHLRIRADGHAPHETVIDPAAGDVTVALLPTPNDAHGLALRLMTPQGEPLAGAIVRATPDGRHVFEGKTDARGETFMAGIAPGRKHVVELEAPGFGLSLTAPTRLLASRERQELLVVPLVAADVRSLPEAPQVVACLDAPEGTGTTMVIAQAGVPLHLTREDQRVTLYAPGRAPRTLALSAQDLRPGFVLDTSLAPGPSLRIGLKELLEATDGPVEVRLSPVALGRTRRHRKLLPGLHESFVVRWSGRQESLDVESMTPGRWRLTVTAAGRRLCEIELTLEEDTDLGTLVQRK